jgi:hypothetical protein
VLHPLASRQYLSPRVLNLALQYLTRALELKGTYKQLKPNVEPLLSQVGIKGCASVAGTASGDGNGVLVIAVEFLRTSPYVARHGQAQPRRSG